MTWIDYSYSDRNYVKFERMSLIYVKYDAYCKKHRNSKICWLIFGINEFKSYINDQSRWIRKLPISYKFAICDV